MHVGEYTKGLTGDETSKDNNMIPFLTQNPMLEARLEVYINHLDSVIAWLVEKTIAPSPFSLSFSLSGKDGAHSPNNIEIKLFKEEGPTASSKSRKGTCRPCELTAFK